MAVVTGKASLKKFSREITLPQPVFVSEIPEILGMDAEYHENIIVTRDNRVLMQDELIFDGDEVEIFIAVMGG